MFSHQDFAILVISSDRYSDLWNPFFKCFTKMWPDCPYKVYLGSNQIEYQNEKNVKSILSGPDTDWSSSLIKILNQIPEHYLFIFLEDFFPISKIDTYIMREHFNFMKKNEINHMHQLYDSVPYDIYLNEHYGIYEKGAPYRVNVYGFWNKKCLENLLIPGESPWNFEIMGSYRSSYFEKFYAILQPPFKIMNMVEKGKYFRSAVEYSKYHNIPLIFENRILLDKKSTVVSDMKKYVFILVNQISWKHRLKFMNFMRRLLSCY